jgi:hypothetical protein
VVNREVLAQRRDRTHAVVEGALLADIAIVFLLMRAFLPLPGVRQLLRALATVPFVMLMQRRGLRLTILAAIASYILLSALIGPLLALAAIDIAVAGFLAGLGRKMGLGVGLNTLFTGPIYAFLDLVLPTIASVIIFQYPVKKLIQGARNFVKLIFSFFANVAQGLGASPALVHHINDAKAWSAEHWVVPFLASYIVYGWLTMYLAVLIADVVLRQLPAQTLARQRAA